MHGWASVLTLSWNENSFIRTLKRKRLYELQEEYIVIARVVFSILAVYDFRVSIAKFTNGFLVTVASCEHTATK